MKRKTHTTTPQKFGWRPAQWATAVGISRSLVYEMLEDGRLESVKLGRARIVTTDPQDYLVALAKEAA